MVSARDLSRSAMISCYTTLLDPLLTGHLASTAHIVAAKSRRVRSRTLDLEDGLGAAAVGDVQRIRRIVHDDAAVAPCVRHQLLRSSRAVTAHWVGHFCGNRKVPSCGIRRCHDSHNKCLLLHVTAAATSKVEHRDIKMERAQSAARAWRRRRSGCWASRRR